MPKNSTLAIAVAMGSLLTLSACQKAEEPASKTTTAPTQAATVQTDAKPTTTQPATAAPQVTYKTVSATVRDTGEKIEIRVPENEGIDSGRLIEIREMADGTYTFKSVIPN